MSHCSSMTATQKGYQGQTAGQADCKKEGGRRRRKGQEEEVVEGKGLCYLPEQYFVNCFRVAEYNHLITQSPDSVQFGPTKMSSTVCKYFQFLTHTYM